MRFTGSGFRLELRGICYYGGVWTVGGLMNAGVGVYTSGPIPGPMKQHAMTRRLSGLFTSIGSKSVFTE